MTVETIKPLNLGGVSFGKALCYGDHRPEAERAFASRSRFATELARHLYTLAGGIQQLADLLANSGLALEARFNAQRHAEIRFSQPA